MIKGCIKTSLFLLTTACATSSAWAQTAHSDAGEIHDDIVVTAQKRTERLQDVPVPVSAVSAAQLLDRNQSRLQDYFATVPGLNATFLGNGQTNIAVRGLSTGQSGNPTVGVVIDDVPFGSSTLLGYGSRILPDLDPSALARVEVLRGPQGTLYGASSIGGLLKFVTNDPSTTEVSGRVQADVNNVSHGDFGYGLRGSVNLPISSNLAIRASGFYRRDGGYVDNILTGQDNVNSAKAYGGHFVALWKPTDTVSLKLAALLQDTNGDGSSEVEGNYLLQPTLGQYVQSRIPNTGQYSIKVRLYSAVLNVDLGAAQFTSITGYGVNRYTGVLDQTPLRAGAANGFFGVNYAAADNNFLLKKFSQEVRLTSTGDHFINWLIGGFYTREKNTPVQTSRAVNELTNQTAGYLFTSVFPSTLQEIAAFGDITLKFSKAFDVQFGARYGKNRQTYQETDTGAFYPTPFFLDAYFKDSAFTFLVTPRYRFSENLMAYIRVASGYRVGGPNPGAGFGFPVGYKNDTTVNYEIGVKGSTPDQVLTYDISAFYIDWKDIQVVSRDPATGFLYFSNGDAASSKGVEATLTLRPRKGLTIAANGAYTDAKLDKDLPVAAGAGLKGDRLPLSTRFSGSLSVDQEFPVSQGFDGFVGASVAYVGKRQGDYPRNSSFVRLTYPEYVTLDLRAGARSDVWSLTVAVSNVTNAHGVVGGNSRLSTTPVTAPYGISYIRPRTASITLARTF